MLKEIVLTGGPSGGKTSAINNIKWELEKRGFKVFIAPEAATDYMAMGLDIAGGKFPPRRSQMQINERILANREVLRGWAKHYARAVIIYDRFVMDGAAYYDQNYWTLLKDQGLNWFTACQWPDLVIHMVSPAVDKPEVYNWENNPHRYSTVKSAKEEDRKTMQAWVSHSHFRVIGNEDNYFMTKVQRAVEHAIHITKNFEIERKFLVKKCTFNDMILQAHSTKMIEQIYCHLTRYSRCTWQGQSTYQMALKKGEGARRTESESWMTANEWANVVRNSKDFPEVNKPRYLTKTRDNFVWNNRFYELDSIVDGPTILEIELLDEDEKYVIPPFIEIEREVTDEPEYMSKNMAR